MAFAWWVCHVERVGSEEEQGDPWGPVRRAGAPALETGQLAVSMTYLFLLVFHVTFLKKQTEQL